MSPDRKRVAIIGECMIELNGAPFGTDLRQASGGDSLNTALYLARLASDSVQVRYVTAMGTDTLSEEIVRRWQGEGLDITWVLRDPTRLPGLYWISVDETGERAFRYWRGESAARYWLRHPDSEQVLRRLGESDLLYLSAVSLAILPEKDRGTLLARLTELSSCGVPIALDSNYRPALWSSPDIARAATHALLPATGLVFASFEDERALWGDATPEATLARLTRESRAVVVRLGKDGCLYGDGETSITVPALPCSQVIDTTGAGDAFNAAFLGGWLADHAPRDCCRAGHQLAHAVIQYPGAIIPASATPALSQLFASAS